MAEKAELKTAPEQQTIIVRHLFDISRRKRK